jgi:hypothetical protein
MTAQALDLSRFGHFSSTFRDSVLALWPFGAPLQQHGEVVAPQGAARTLRGVGPLRCSFNPGVPRASLLIPARTCTIRSLSQGRRLDRSFYSAGRCDAERAMNKTPGLLRDFPRRCVHFGAVLFHFRPGRRKRAAP